MNTLTPYHLNIGTPRIINADLPKTTFAIDFSIGLIVTWQDFPIAAYAANPKE